jgi:hypothetical protein
MFDFLNKPYPFSTDLRLSLRLASGIAIGVFLFILFFQPLELDPTDTNSYILTIAGFAGITFLVISLMKIIVPWALRGRLRIDLWDIKKEIVLLLSIWILNSVAFPFYLAYVGHVPMTMYLEFKIVLICLVSPVVIILVNKIHLQKDSLQETQQTIKELEEQSGSSRSEKKQMLELNSDNRTEKLVLEPQDLILVRSAENYVEIIFRENQAINRKLLRSTMMAIEDQLRSFPNLVRCHRTCIINAVPGVKMHRTVQGIKLRIPGYDEEVPVSRQYLMGVRAILEKNGL